jgi:hypothetical protein
VLAEYRFTNVYRELDTQSIWIAENWIHPHAHLPDAWFAALIARHINWAETLAELNPLPWNQKSFLRTMHARDVSGAQLFTGAYMINQSIPGGKGLKKYEYLQRFIFDEAWAGREYLRPRMGDTLDNFHSRLMELRGLGSFMAAQVVADVKHTGFLSSATDNFEWAASGPGSKRGMNEVCGRAPEQTWKESEWRESLTALLPLVNTHIHKHWPRIDGQNLQNCLCEFSKYVRGYSRSRYQRT